MTNSVSSGTVNPAILYCTILSQSWNKESMLYIVNCCCGWCEMMTVYLDTRVSQREKQNSADATDAVHDTNPVRQRLMHMLGLTMPPRTASTATQTAVNSHRSAGTQTDQASTPSTSSSSYRFARYWSTWTLSPVKRIFPGPRCPLVIERHGI